MSRFTVLVRGLGPPDGTSTVRTNKASQGRKPKIKSERDLSTPVFTTNNKGNLNMSVSVNLKLIALALDMVERL